MRQIDHDLRWTKQGRCKSARMACYLLSQSIVAQVNVNTLSLKCTLDPHPSQIVVCPCTSRSVLRAKSGLVSGSLKASLLMNLTSACLQWQWSNVVEYCGSWSCPYTSRLHGCCLADFLE